MQSLKNSSEYRVRLGVANSLNLMKQPVVIDNKDHIRSIVDLIGDSKAEIRKNTSSFLLKLTDSLTVNLVIDELKKTIQKRSNGNAVYNAAIILITVAYPPLELHLNHIFKMLYQIDFKPARFNSVYKKLFGFVIMLTI